MGFTDPVHRVASHAHTLTGTLAPKAGGGGGIGGILRTIEGTVGGLSNTITSVFDGLGGTGLADAITKAILVGFFHQLLVWVATGAASLVGALGAALSASTEPVLTGRAFRNEFAVMAVLSAAVALPLLAAGAIQAIARQEPGPLLRSTLMRLPLALLFTGVSVQLVALGLAATDQASAMMLDAAGDPTHRLLLGLVAGLSRGGGLGLAAFGGFMVVLAAAIVSFVLWLELAVRSAAIAAASLFLPLALAGLAWPATAHWARRLGETLAALVLSKLVIAAVLALAAGLLGSSSGLAGVVEGIALLAIAGFAPFALLKLVPAIEAGATAHFEGLGRRSVHAAERLGSGVAKWEIAGVEEMGSFAGAALGGSSAGGSPGGAGSPGSPGGAGSRSPGGAGSPGSPGGAGSPVSPVGAASPGAAGSPSAVGSPSGPGGRLGPGGGPGGLAPSTAQLGTPDEGAEASPGAPGPVSGAADSDGADQVSYDRWVSALARRDDTDD